MNEKLTEKRKRQREITIRVLAGEDSTRIASEFGVSKQYVHLLKDQALKNVDEMHEYWSQVKSLAYSRPTKARMTREGCLSIKKISHGALGYAREVSVEFDPKTNSLLLSSLSGKEGHGVFVRKITVRRGRRILSIKVILNRYGLEITEGVYQATFEEGKLRIAL